MNIAKKKYICSMQFFNWLSKRLGKPDWHQHNDIKFIITYTAWKAAKNGIFHGPYFPIFGESLYSVRMQENTDQKISVFWHFLRSVIYYIFFVISIILHGLFICVFVLQHQFYDPVRRRTINIIFSYYF